MKLDRSRLERIDQLSQNYIEYIHMALTAHTVSVSISKAFQ